MKDAMVIDDSRAMRRILADYLTELGFERVAVAENGRAGLDSLGAQACPAVCLVDWNMPVMDGLEFVRAVRSDARFRQLPVIVVTTEIELGKVAEALETGADEYIMKPFTCADLEGKLRQLGVVR